MPPRVSLCLIVKNAEASLPACLASTADLVDEIILVDTGSTDRTKKVANDFNVRLVDFAWIDSFSAARNACLGHARGDWIFYLDADECLDEANREKLRALLGGLGKENTAYLMTVRSRLAKDREPPVAVARVCLFRNRPEHRWKYRVHEQILPALLATGASVHATEVVIEHAGYADAALGWRKLERNLHLLQRDLGDHPEDPFVLLYLGWSYLDLGQAAEALPFLCHAQERAHPTFSLLPLLFTLQVRCLKQLSRRQEAFAMCAAGRTRFPADAALLFEEALLQWRYGDPAGAESCLRQLLDVPAGADRNTPPRRGLPPGARALIPISEGLRGYLARHHLALLWFEQGRVAEAEVEWRAVLTEQPAFAPARIQLGEIFMAQERWTELEQVTALLESAGSAPLEAALLQARAHLARQAFTEAHQIVEKTLAQYPDAIGPRVLRTQILLQEGQEEAAEKALGDVLQRDPGQVESWRNLAKLLRNQNRLAETAAVCAQGRKSFPDEPDLLRLEGLALHELNQPSAAAACLQRFLEIQAGQYPPGVEDQERRALVRYHLGQIFSKQERFAEAEAQWQALLTEMPTYTAAWLELCNLYLAQERWQELEQVAQCLEAEFHLTEEAALVRASAHLGRHELAAAASVVQRLLLVNPQSTAGQHLFEVVQRAQAAT